MLQLSILIASAFILDLLLGDPVYALHPVRIIGKGISTFEKILRRNFSNDKVGGILLVIKMCFIVIAVFFIISFLLNSIHPLLGFFFSIYICYSCLAIKDLSGHINRVINAIKKKDLQEARSAVAMVVGRETQCLEMEGVCRASIETMAENFVDGFLSPLFWCLTGGITGYLLKIPIVETAISLMLVLKAASTLDSMVGYKNETYYNFGWAGARFDDVMNYIPARLSLFVLFLGAFFIRLHPLRGFRIAVRDRLKHDSPNAAHAESFVAGALGVRLGGPTVYPEGLKEKPWLGDEFRDPTPDDIGTTDRLILFTSIISAVLSIILLLLLFRSFSFQLENMNLRRSKPCCHTVNIQKIIFNG